MIAESSTEKILPIVKQCSRTIIVKWVKTSLKDKNNRLLEEITIK
jgi:hypothetical protein